MGTRKTLSTEAWPFDPEGRFAIQCDPGHLVYDGPPPDGRPLRFPTFETAHAYMLSCGWDHMTVVQQVWRNKTNKSLLDQTAEELASGWEWDPRIANP